MVTASPHRHGGAQDAELRALGIDRERLVDFSVNTNPYGPTPGMVGAIRAAAIDRYPDPTGQDVREGMATWLAEPASDIALGNGAAELLWTLARVLCPGARTLLVEPTFSEFRRAARASGATLLGWHASPRNGFEIDLGAVERSLHVERASVLYLCTPNTPTGVGLPAADVAAVAERNPALTLVLDQSFLSLSDRSGDAGVRMPANVVRVRSLTKEHAIPGVRVGYLLARAELVAQLEEQRPAWTASSLALAAASAAGAERAFVAESRRRLFADRARLIAGVRALGLQAFDSSTVFFLVRVGSAAELRRRLLVRHHVLVRDCASFGLPEFVRVAVRPEADASRLLASLAAEAPAC